MSIFALGCLYKIITMLRARRLPYVIEKTVKQEYRERFFKLELRSYLSWAVLFVGGDFYSFFFIDRDAVTLIDIAVLIALGVMIIAIQIHRLKTQRKMYY